MRIWKELYSVEDFDAWGGAVETVNSLTEDQIETLDSMLDEIFPDGCEETDFNDWLAYENDSIAEMLGFEDWDDLINQNENEDEEDDDE